MCSAGRYSASGAEVEFEPGSGRRVLRNRLGINRVREMNRIETEFLFRALDSLVDELDREHTFTEADLQNFHKLWLGDIYEWAGRYRNTNLSKDGFHFAAAHVINAQMRDIERTVLSRYTPCTFETEEEVIEALSIVHAELVLIHPFREGNGRLSRLLVTLMAYQAGYPTLDFSAIKGRKKREYFGAVQTALGQDYGPMKQVFKSVLKRSVSQHGQRRAT